MQQQQQHQQHQDSSAPIRVEVHHWHHRDGTSSSVQTQHNPRGYVELANGATVKLVSFAEDGRSFVSSDAASGGVSLMLKGPDHKVAKEAAQWKLVISPTKDGGQVHSFRNPLSGRFLRICKDGAVDCKGKEGGALTLFKMNRVHGSSFTVKSAATGLYLSIAGGVVSSGPQATNFRVRTVPAGPEPWRKHAFRHRQTTNMGPLVVRLHPLPIVSKPVHLAAPVEKPASSIVSPALSKEDRLRLKEERLRAKEERLRAKQEEKTPSASVVAPPSALSKEDRLRLKEERLRAKEERVRVKAQEREERMRTKQEQKMAIASSPSDAIPFVDKTIALMPVQFLETANRSQEKGWCLGFSPSGFIVADAAQGPWSQFRVRSAGQGAVIFESVHSPQWHLAVRPNLQITHKGGLGKFAQFKPSRQGPDSWSFRSVAHENAFLAISAQGLLHVATEESLATRFKVNLP